MSAPAISRAFALLSLAVSLICAASRVASDRWLFSQYAFWIPQEAYVLLAIVLSALAATVRLTCSRPGLSSIALRASVVAWIVLTCHLVLVQWRAANLFRLGDPGVLKLLNWNVTAIEDDINLIGPIKAQAPDIAILANPMGRAHWREVIDAFPDPKALIWESGFIVLSHVPILRHGCVSLGIENALADTHHGPRQLDPGRALFFEADTKAQLGRTTIIWVVDLPSDWHRSRWEMAGRAAAAIAGWTGVPTLHDQTGELTFGPPGAGFPKPDLVVGDFNSPRRSASHRRIVGDMTDAFDQAGIGYAASWPDQGFHAPFPLLHLDHIFLAPWLRATSYRLVHPPFAYHRMQVAELRAAQADR